MSIRVVSAVFVLSMCLSSFGGRNKYMDPDKDEFKEVTATLADTWKIQSYSRKKTGEMINSTYTKGTASLSEIKKKKRPGKAVFTFTVSPETIQGRIDAWNAKKKELEVDEYRIITKADWSISKKGDIIYFNKPVLSVEISGSGEQLENFQGFENGLVESSSEMKNQGGLGNLIGSKIMDKSSGTEEFLPKIPSQAEIVKNDDNSVTLRYLKKTTIELQRVPE